MGGGGGRAYNKIQITSKISKETLTQKSIADIMYCPAGCILKGLKLKSKRYLGQFLFISAYIVFLSGSKFSTTNIPRIQGQNRKFVKNNVHKRPLTVLFNIKTKKQHRLLVMSLQFRFSINILSVCPSTQFSFFKRRTKIGPTGVLTDTSTQVLEY